MNTTSEARQLLGAELARCEDLLGKHQRECEHQEKCKVYQLKRRDGLRKAIQILVGADNNEE